MLLIVAAAAGAAIVHLVVAAVHFNALASGARRLGPPWAAAMILIAVLAHAVQWRSSNPALSRALVALLTGLAAGFVTLPLTAGLHGTPQPLNTILGGDQSFRTEYVTRFASTWRLDDYTFKGLHAFYPPAWFWAAGRTAHLFGVHETWRIVKPFTIFTIGAALGVSFLLWRTALSPAGALSAAIGSSLVLRYQAGSASFATQSWYSAYSCLVAVIGAAWVAAALHTLRRPAAGWRLAALALVGAALALSYYLLFIILVVVLVVVAALTPTERRLALTRLAALIVGVLLLTAVFWVPLLGVLLHGAASQGHYVAAEFHRVQGGVWGGPVALTVLSVIALIALALTFRSSSSSRAVGALIVGTIVYQAISVITLDLAHNQLQPHRAVTMMWATYGAALPVAFERLRREEGLARRVAAYRPRLLAAGAGLLGVAAIFWLGWHQGSDLAGGRFTRKAHAAPSLARPRAISTFITRTSHRKPRQLVIVSGDRALMVTKPYWGFVALRARYANPEANLPQRVAVLRAAASCADPACTTRLLTTTKYGPVGALVLARTPAGLRIQTQLDHYPNPRRVRIFFRPGSFDPAVWARRDFGPYAVLVRRPPR